MRVVLTDEQLGELRFEVPVMVDNGEEGAADDLAPWAHISSPRDGSVVAGAVDVSGSALSGEMVEALVEVGAGFNPLEWTRIARLTILAYNTRLARWDTTGAPDGTYTLRVTVLDRRLGSTRVSVVVTVKNDPDR